MKPYPKVKLRLQPPSHRFTRWVDEFGRSRLARAMGVSRSLIYRWLLGAAKPTAENALTIVALSEVEPLDGKRPLTLTDVIGAAEVINVEVRK